METFSALLALCAGNSPVTGEFPAQRPVTRSFDVFFDLRLYKRLSKQFRGWWSETPSWSLWRHCNDWWKSQTHNWCHKQYYKVHIVIPLTSLMKIWFHSNRLWNRSVDTDFTLVFVQRNANTKSALPYFTEKHQGTRKYINKYIWIQTHYKQSKTLDENIKQWYKIIEYNVEQKWHWNDRDDIDWGRTAAVRFSSCLYTQWYMPETIAVHGCNNPPGRHRTRRGRHVVASAPITMTS